MGAPRQQAAKAPHPAPLPVRAPVPESVLSDGSSSIPTPPTGCLHLELDAALGTTASMPAASERRAVPVFQVAATPLPPARPLQVSTPLSATEIADRVVRQLQPADISRDHASRAQQPAPQHIRRRQPRLQHQERQPEQHRRSAPTRRTKQRSSSEVKVRACVPPGAVLWHSRLITAHIAAGIAAQATRTSRSNPGAGAAAGNISTRAAIGCKSAGTQRSRVRMRASAAYLRLSARRGTISPERVPSECVPSERVTPRGSHAATCNECARSQRAGTQPANPRSHWRHRASASTAAATPTPPIRAPCSGGPAHRNSAFRYARARAVRRLIVPIHGQ